MNNKPVNEPAIVVCPKCWYEIKTANMIGEYIVYKCKKCGWKTPQSMFYKIGKTND